MKTFKISELKVPIFQGDIMLKAVPAEDRPESKRLDDNVIAHSETGHHHTAENGAVFGLDPMTMFLKPNGRGFVDGVPYVDIVHHRDYSTHETYRLLFDDPGYEIKIKRQREKTPEGWRRVED